MTSFKPRTVSRIECARLRVPCDSVHPNYCFMMQIDRMKTLTSFRNVMKNGWIWRSLNSIVWMALSEWAVSFLKPAFYLCLLHHFKMTAKVAAFSQTNNASESVKAYYLVGQLSTSIVHKMLKLWNFALNLIKA